MADADVGLVVFILARDLHETLLDGVAALERGHEPGVERHFREIAAGRGQGRHRVIGVRLHFFRFEAAGRGHVVLVRAPEGAEPDQAFLAFGRRHVVAAEHLDRRLVLADAEHVPVDRELVDRVLDEHAVAGEAVDVGDAVRIEVDLVGAGREVVLALVVEVAVGDDRLAALAEGLDCVGHVPELGEAGPAHAAEIEVQRADALVVLAGLDRVDQVAQQCFARQLAQALGQRALERVTAQLLDDRSLRGDDQRGPVGHQRNRAGEDRPERAEEQQQQDEVQDLAQPVEAVPDPAQHSSDRSEHGGSPRQ